MNPEQNWMADYLFFNSGNEAAQNYHFWSGMSALSAIMGRRVWVDFGYFKVYPNLYVVLLGPPGNKKTTALGCAKGLIRKLEVVPMSADCQTKESFVIELTNYERSFQLPFGTDRLIYTPCSLFLTELSQFIEVDPARWLDFLTTVYDQDVYDRKTKNQGSQLIQGPYVTLLACTTPQWITTYLRSDIITGGFSRRTVFVLETGSGKRIPFPVITPDQQAAYDRMFARSRQLLDLGGEFKFDDESRRFYENWYLTRKITDIACIKPFDDTLHIQMIKVAMLLAVCRENTLILRREYLELALTILQELMQRLPRVFEGMGRNELARIASQVLDMLIAAGPLPEKDLRSMLFKDASQQEQLEVLSHLERTGQIKRILQTLKSGDTRVWILRPEDEAKLPQAARAACASPKEPNKG